MKLKFIYLIVAVLCVAVCLSACVDKKNKTGSTGSEDKSSAVETVSQNESTDSESENSSIEDEFSLNGEEKQNMELPFVPKEQSNSQASDSQNQTNQSSGSAQQSQQTVQPGDNGQCSTTTDPYEGGGY